MTIATGALLVLITWALAASALISIGLLPALAVTSSRRGERPLDRAVTIRLAMWWGLVIVALFAFLTNFWFPLHSGVVGGLFLILVLSFGVPGWLLLTRRPSLRGRGPRSWTAGLLWVALAASAVYLALAALGPVTNYDTGLYHLGAIAYASEYPTIPGLANLFFPLGYSSAQFPLAALLGNGPWQENGFRLLNGLIMVLAALDLFLRSRGRRRGVGFYVLAVGIVAAWVPLIALSDYWVTSPTQDASVFVLTLVATALLTQAVWGGRTWLGEASTAIVIGMLLVLIRPTMVVFSAAIVIVVLILILRRRPSGPPARWALTLVPALAISAIVLSAARDARMSGWLQYPLSIYPFDVPWRAPDPAMERLATLGYHRNQERLWESVNGWEWVGPWLTARLTQWETYEFLALVFAAVVLVIRARLIAGRRFRLRSLLLALAPNFLGVIFWWTLTPPAYRFAWGVLFSLAVIPIGWSLWLLASSLANARHTPSTWDGVTNLGIGIPILIVIVVSVLTRLDLERAVTQKSWAIPFSIQYSVVPIPAASVEAFETQGGLALTRPKGTELCWSEWPLCTPLPIRELRLVGSRLHEGLLR